MARVARSVLVALLGAKGRRKRTARAYACAMWPTGRPPYWVGRARELGVLRDSLEALRQGRGSVAWIEGEPGIGKSSLVAEAMAASDPGWDVGWGMADQLSERLPLRVMLECLQVRSSSPDPRRARAADTTGVNLSPATRRCHTPFIAGSRYLAFNRDHSPADR